jgi:membrane-bound lytic murein transglycosylase D
LIKARLIFSVTFAIALAACNSRAQETVTIDDLAESARQWAQENLDEDVLAVLQQADQKKVEEFLRQLQKQLQGEYVIDLAQLRQGAKTILPLLENYSETLPYALWLKTRLDYLDVADELRLLIPSPKPGPGELPKPPLVPPARAREIWIRKFLDRPQPAAAKPYLSKLKPIFTEEKVPSELVWVAEVESSFDPRARSPAGAAGLFQLMPVTAKEYGLRTWPFDQRLNAETNARAAARHLRKLYARYKDWQLALAAYNAGQGTVDSLLSRHKAHSFDAIARYLPAETQLYVPKINAVLREREGIELKKLSEPARGL